MRNKAVWLAGTVSPKGHASTFGVFSTARRAVKACGLPDHFVTGPVPLNVPGPYNNYFRYKYTWFPLRETRAEGKKRVDERSNEPVFTGVK